VSDIIRFWRQQAWMTRLWRRLTRLLIDPICLVLFDTRFDTRLPD
jgi:hypothetical protein